MDHNDIDRLEAKVDKLTDAMTGLVLFIERQAVQATTLADHGKRIRETEQKLAAWINRGIGAWGIAAVAFSAYRAFT